MAVLGCIIVPRNVSKRSHSFPFLLQVALVRAAASQTSSCAGMESVFLVCGSAMVKMNVVMLQTSAAAPHLLPSPNLASALLTLFLALRPSPPTASLHQCAATASLTAPMGRTNWAALTPHAVNVWGISTAHLLLQIFSGTTGAQWESLGAPGCWTPKTPNPLCCSWTCSQVQVTPYTCMTVSSSEQNTSCRCCPITITEGRHSWNPAADR